MNNLIRLWTLVLVMSGLSMNLLASISEISDVEMAQDSNSRLVTIRYRLTGDPGIITLDIQTNGVSIGMEHIHYVDGEVNKKVDAGIHTITWRPDKSWAGHRVTNATAKVFAWSLSAPPDYMAIWLDDPLHKINWYTCEEALPGGIGNAIYRENVLLLRQIHQPDGSRWMMGWPSSEYGSDKSKTARHSVSLTENFWIGVFEITQKQWEWIMGDRPSGFQGENWAARPVENVSYERIRGESSTSYYPNSPKTTSFLGNLRAISGLAFDLPSEMQWEYACRAGQGGALNNGAEVSVLWGTDPEMSKLGRYQGNGGQKNVEGKWVTDQASAPVGSYQPNDWGLYDMHGNVWEWCLDWYADDISALDGAVNVSIPTGETKNRVRRGGGWNSNAPACRSANRYHAKPSMTNTGVGLRVACPVGQ